MAVIRDPGQWGKFTENLGQGLSAFGNNFGNTVNTGLNAILNQKVQDYAQRSLANRIAPGIEKLYNLSPEEAQLAANQPMEILSSYLKGKQQEPYSLGLSEVIRMLNGDQGQEQPQTEGILPEIAEQIAPAQKKTSTGQALKLKPQDALNVLKVKNTMSENQKNRAFKEQAAIEKANEPFIKSLRQDDQEAEDQIELVDRMLQALETGEVPENEEGALAENLYKYASIRPTTDAGKVFLMGQEELAGKIASQLRGPVGQAKLQFARGTKPSIANSRAVNEKWLRDYRKGLVEVRKARESLENTLDKGPQPKNLEGILFKELKLGGGKKEATPEKRNLKEGEVFKFRGKPYKWVNGKPQELVGKE
jgi:hypothetical protein